MPKMAQGDFDRYAFHFWNQHKHTFGVKLEIVVATQKTPVPLAATVAPAGWSDLAIAQHRLGTLSHMHPTERLLADPGYRGESQIYAPPTRNMRAYVEELDKSELTLQRRVEMCNRHVKEFNSLGTTYRKGAVRAFRDLEKIALAVVKLVYLDLMLNQEHTGKVHITGPIKPLVVHRKVPISGPGARARALKRLKSNSNSRQRLKKQRI